MKNKKRYLKNSMFILPSLFTLANMVCGFYAVILAFNSEWLKSGALLSIAGIMDGLDGMVARATKTTSKFGFNFDSIVDVVSFGVCPALVVYLKWLKPEEYGGNKYGWMLAFLFLMAGSIRLARFNVLAVTEDNPKKDFKGLPITGAALLISTSLWVYSKYSGKILNISGHHIVLDNYLSIIPELIPGTLIVLTYLMVSKIRYSSLKRINLRKINPFILLFLLSSLIFLLMMFPGFILFTFSLCYVLSGPVKTIFQLRKLSERRMIENEEQNKY